VRGVTNPQKSVDRIPCCNYPSSHEKRAVVPSRGIGHVPEVWGCSKVESLTENGREIFFYRDHRTGLEKAKCWCTSPGASWRENGISVFHPLLCSEADYLTSRFFAH